MRILRLPVGELQANCYIVFDEEHRAAVIDPGAQADSILSAVREHGLLVEAILLTHVHYDHMMAAAEVAAATGAPVMAPADDAAALSSPLRNLAALFAPGLSVKLTADRLLGDGEEIAVGTLAFRVLHTPGHTPGSSSFLCGDALFTGDTLFQGGIGRTDFPGGDSAVLRQSLAALAALPGDYTVLPGHGPDSTLDAERRTNPYMEPDDDAFDM